ncbi:MAG: PKD domain-containing protein [Bacteroidota bacterium]|nr:PKD domain-containing protein [Bacteroidota bacterium]
MKRCILIGFLFLNYSAFAQSTAFIYGGGNLCDNAGTIDVEISLTGTAPWNIVYAINGVSQPSISTSSNPHILSAKTAGVYTIVSVSDAVGVGTTSGSAIVNILQALTAQFTITPDTLSIMYPTAKFKEKTVNATSWSWNFGDNTAIDNSQNPIHTYDSAVAVYQVTLVAADANGCTDTTFRQIWVNDEYYIYIPSSFTPDWDGINDKLCLYYHAIREHTFDFKVYNMRGEVVFFTKSIKNMVCDNFAKNGWEGIHNKSGKELPTGNYVYEVYFQDFEGWKHHDFGFLHLIR